MAAINIKTGEPEELDPVQLTEGLASGTHLPPAGQGVLLNPTGELVFVPAEDVQENIARYGYRMPQPDELRKLGRDFKYGSDTMQLQAGLAGAARGGTFGVSDYLAVKTGLTSPEHLSALKEYFPGTSLIGELGGAVATAPFSFTPAGLAVKGARAAEAAAVGQAASLLPKSAMANAIARTAVETGGKALGGAIEGLAFGLGQTVSEAALGDPDLTAENVIGHLGQSAILGGALGAGFKVGSLAAKKTLEKAKKVYQSAFENLVGKTVVGPKAVGEQAGIPGFNVAELGDDLDDEVTSLLSKQLAEEEAQAAGQPVFEPGILTKKLAKASSVTSGIPEEEILEKFAAEMDPKRIVLTTAEKDAKVKVFGENIEQIYNVSKKLTKSMSKNVRPQEMSGLLEDIAIDRPLAQYVDTANGLRNAVNEMKKEPLLYDPGIVRTAEKIVERMDENVQKGFKNSYAVYDDLVENRRLLEDLERFEKPRQDLPRAEQKALNEFITPLRVSIKDSLTDQNIWGEAGARQSAYNEKFSSLLKWTTALEKNIMKKVSLGEATPIYVVNPVKVNTMFNQINDYRTKIPTLSTTNFLKSFREFIEQAEESIKNAPDVKMDVKALKDFTGKLSDEALAAKQYVSEAFGGYGFFRDLMDAAKSGGLGGMAAQIGTAFTKPENIIKGLSKVEKWSQATSKAVDKATKVIFEKVKPPTRGIGVMWDQLSPVERAEKYKKYVEKLKNLTDVPDHLLDSLENATNETFEIAPKFTQAIQMATVRGISFLLQKMPQPIDQSILDAPYEPSQAEMLTFGRYVDVVENPTVVLKQLEENYVPKESLETLREVYPAFYGELKTQLLNNIAEQVEKKGVIPYQRRIVLSRFLEMPLDSSFKPDLISRNQMALAGLAGQKAQEEAQRTSQTGLGKVSLADRSQTGLEKVTARA
jgi:hypothetical protein